MGRPIKKKHFGTGSSTQIKVRAKIGSSAEGYGYIVAQKGTNKYIVTVGSDTDLCQLVNKANGTLAAGEMTISVTDGTTVSKVLFVKRHQVKFADGSVHAWKFDAAAGSFVHMEQITDTFSGPQITISAQPANSSVTAPAAATFSVTAAVSQSQTLSYQWQISTNGGTSYTNITNTGVYTTATTSTLHISNSTGLTGMKYRCVVSATGGAVSVNSTAATLTVA